MEYVHNWKNSASAEKQALSKDTTVKNDHQTLEGGLHCTTCTSVDGVQANSSGVDGHINARQEQINATPKTGKADKGTGTLESDKHEHKASV